mmetsp:Transcript_10917/g.23106  ORF Transcript_10917/g.23106 Transcript_10917/m.23106 type:complete len:332 (-) Transcript_10917:729-1724(-)
MSSDYNFGQYANGGGTQDGDRETPGGYYTHPNDATDYGQVAKDVAVLFLTGIAIVIALIALVYVGAVVCDRLCRRFSCCLCFLQLHTDGPRNIVGGEVARDAGLTGMTESERRLVMDKILIGKPYHICREDSANEEKDSKDDGQHQQSSESSTNDDAANNSTTDNRTPPEQEPAEPQHDVESAPSPQSNPQFESDSYIACAICIDEYGQDDEVVIGEACQHMFHKQCLLDWLQRHDGCPCCRKNMITSQEMKDAAMEVLGRRRVMQLTLGTYSGAFGFDDSVDDARRPRIGFPQASVLVDLELGNGTTSSNAAGEGFRNDERLDSTESRER